MGDDASSALKDAGDELDLDAVAPEETADEKDFDADLDGEIEGNLRFKVRGRWYESPKDPPAEAILLVMRRDLSLDNAKDCADLIDVLVGRDALEQMYRDKIGILHLIKVGAWLASKYGFAIEQQTKAIGEAAPDPLARLSSGGTGEPSRATS